jgi:hypothetical protein
MSLGLLLSFLTLVVSFGPYGSNVGVVAAADGVPIHYSVQGKGSLHWSSSTVGAVTGTSGTTRFLYLQRISES